MKKSKHTGDRAGHHLKAKPPTAKEVEDLKSTMARWVEHDSPTLEEFGAVRHQWTPSQWGKELLKKEEAESEGKVMRRSASSRSKSATLEPAARSSQGMVHLSVTSVEMQKWNGPHRDHGTQKSHIRALKVGGWVGGWVGG